MTPLGEMVKLRLHQQGFPRLAQQVFDARPIFDDEGTFSGVGVMLPDEVQFDAAADEACRSATDAVYKLLKAGLGEPADDLVPGGEITLDLRELL